MRISRPFTAWLSVSTALVLSSLAGCKGAGSKTDTAAAVAIPSGPVEGMRSLPHPVDTVANTQAYLAQLVTTNGDSLKALVSVDSQMVAMLVAHCEAMMRRMKRARPANWATSVAMLQDDAVRMRSMSPADLISFMPAHRKRIEALLEMHRTMSEM